MIRHHSLNRLSLADTTATVSDGKLAFLVLMGFLFLLGLGMPIISQALVYVVAFFLLLQWRGSVAKSFALQLLLLGMFGFTYYLILYQYGFIDLVDAIHRPLFFMGCYIVGYSIKKERTPNWPDGLALPMLAPVVGLLVWMFLLLFLATPQQLFEAQIARQIGGFWPWGGERPLVATAIGLYASLGICLFPILLLLPSRFLKKHQIIALWFIAIAMAVVAFYATTIFQDRAPLLTLCLAFVVCSGIYIFGLKRVESSGTKLVKTLLITILFGLSVYIIANYVDVNDVFTRLTNRGIGSSRYAAWSDFIISFPHHLMGGRTANINGLDFANNIWLDVGYSSGIIPLVFLLIFHVGQFHNVFKVVKSRLPALIRMLVAAISCAFIVGFVFEPVLSSSVLEFGLSCLFFGIVSRLYHEYARHNRLDFSKASGNYMRDAGRLKAGIHA